MFLTQIHLFIQSLDSPVFNWWMNAISFAGSHEAVLPGLLAVMFFVHLRAGFFLLQVWIWAGAVNGFLKRFFMLPRPVDVDLRVRLLDSHAANTSPFRARGAGSFFSLLPPEVVTYLRAHPISSWGFPSGHCAVSMAIWSSISRLSRKWLVTTAAAIIIFLTAFSRLFLGRHFLAGILGGWLVGWTVALVLYCFLVRPKTLRIWLDQPRARLRAGWLRPAVWFFALAGPGVMFALPQIYNFVAARLLGLNLAFLLLWQQGLPKERGTFFQRTVRGIIGLAIFYTVHTGMPAVAHWLAPGLSLPLIKTLTSFLAPFLALWGGISLGLRIGVWQNESPR